MAHRRRWISAAAIVLLLLCALLAWSGPSLHARAALGTAYGARIACSCRYVEGREMASCETDKEPGMALVSLTDHPDEKLVEASVPLLARRAARYRPGWGCLLDPVP